MREHLDTARLRLSLFRSDDVAELHAIFSDPMTHTIGDGPFHSVDQTREWISRRLDAFRTRGLCWYALREVGTGELVGNCGVFIGRTGQMEPEIGYEVRHDRWGRGYATEAATAVAAEAQRAGITRLWATVRPRNGASLRVLDRIGMTLMRQEEDAKGALLYLRGDLNDGAPTAPPAQPSHPA